jgi:hypothetical protein
VRCSIDNHTLLANETVYTTHFHPLPQDETLYATGFAADIVNNKRVHHIVAYLCTRPASAFTERAGKPEVPADEEENGARAHIRCLPRVQLEIDLSTKE